MLNELKPFFFILALMLYYTVACDKMNCLCLNSELQSPFLLRCPYRWINHLPPGIPQERAETREDRGYGQGTPKLTLMSTSIMSSTFVKWHLILTSLLCGIGRWVVHRLSASFYRLRSGAPERVMTWLRSHSKWWQSWVQNTITTNCHMQSEFCTPALISSLFSQHPMR